MAKKLTPLPKLLQKAQKVFNAWVRNRDRERGCISCGGNVDHAGHYFNQGQHSGLRFDETNVHGQCAGCNLFKHGNLIEYGMGIVNRYGAVYHIVLLDKSRTNKIRKWTRSELEDIISQYS
jgi:hypothetical protein